MRLRDVSFLRSPGADTPVSGGVGSRSRIVAQSLRFSNIGVLAILVIFFAVAAPGFFTVTSLVNILNAAAVFLLLAFGETFVMIAGGIDLSVGSMLSLGGIAAASYMSSHYGGHGSGTGLVAAGILIACLVGAAGGVLNGAVITYMKLNPLIVTLGTFGAFLGIADLISNGLPIGNLPPASFTLGNGGLWRIPYIVLIALGFALVLSFVARNTRFGRYCYAVGASRESVRRAGVNLNVHTMLLYGTAGLLAGLAGFLNAAHFASATSSAGANDLLVAIAAVVIGGTPITGGEGKVWGTVIGAVIYTLLQNGFVLMNVASFWQLVVVGVLIILAVYVDEYQRKLRIMIGVSRELESITPAPIAEPASGSRDGGAR